MCGFPLMHLDKHLKVLVQQNKRFVAICEEFPRPPSFSAKDGFDRRVVRVITPGTLIDESFLNPYENNYLLAISPSDSSSWNSDSHEASSNPVGLAWMDVSTGEFFAKSSTYDNFPDELARIRPREIVLDKGLEQYSLHPIQQALREDEGSFISYIVPSNAAILAPTHAIYDYSDDLALPYDTSHTAPSSVFSPCETSAVKLLTTYLHANLLDGMPPLSSPSKEATEGRMQIDSHTIEALEIRENLSERGTKGSLLSVIKRTITSSGTRLLARWLCKHRNYFLSTVANYLIGSPSTSIREINTRQSLVSFLYARPHLREDLSRFLADIEDTTRIVQKFLVGRGDPSDLVSIHTTISVWESIKQRIEMEKTMEQKERGDDFQNEWASIDALLSRMSDLRELSHKIRSALQQDEDLATENITSDLDASRKYGLNKGGINPS